MGNLIIHGDNLHALNLRKRKASSPPVVREATQEKRSLPVRTLKP
jgi:hypothetical protein